MNQHAVTCTATHTYIHVYVHMREREREIHTHTHTRICKCTHDVWALRQAEWHESLTWIRSELQANALSRERWHQHEALELWQQAPQLSVDCALHGHRDVIVCDWASNAVPCRPKVTLSAPQNSRMRCRPRKLDSSYHKMLLTYYHCCCHCILA